MTGPALSRRYTVVDFKTERAIAGTDSLTVAATIARRGRRAGRLVFVRFNFTRESTYYPAAPPIEDCPRCAEESCGACAEHQNDWHYQQEVSQ
jgi:hypothetical protein